MSFQVCLSPSLQQRVPGVAREFFTWIRKWLSDFPSESWADCKGLCGSVSVGCTSPLFIWHQVMLCFCLCLILGVLFPSIEQAVFGSWLRHLGHQCCGEGCCDGSFFATGRNPGLVPLILIPDSNYPILFGENDLCCFSFLFSLAIKVCNSIGHWNFDFCYLCLFLAMMDITF